MSPGGSVIRSAAIGAVQGALESVLLIATSQKYTFAKDWFLVVMIVFVNATGLAFCARYGASLVGVIIAGTLGLLVGGWVGDHLIGDYEHKVPTPHEERFMRIVARGQAKEVPVPGVPEETIRRIPVGAAVGLLIGWIGGAGLYVWLSRSPMDQNASADEDQAANLG